MKKTISFDTAEGKTISIGTSEGKYVVVTIGKESAKLTYDEAEELADEIVIADEDIETGHEDIFDEDESNLSPEDKEYQEKHNKAKSIVSNLLDILRKDLEDSDISVGDISIDWNVR